jgi:hypothetical protein
LKNVAAYQTAVPEIVEPTSASHLECLKVVHIMSRIVSSLPLASFTFALVFFLHAHGLFPQTAQGSCSHTHGFCAQTEHDCAVTHWQG